MVKQLMPPMLLFTSTLKDIAQETIPKALAVPKCFNKPWRSDICKDAITECNRALERLLGLRLAEISDTVRKHLEEIMSPS